MSTQEELSDYLSTTGGDGTDISHNCMACAGPVAEHILRLEGVIKDLDTYVTNLEARISDGEKALKLERKTPAFEPPAKVQMSAASTDTRPGLSVSDVVELVRALKV